jgi:hypothetical protein
MAKIRIAIPVLSWVTSLDLGSASFCKAQGRTARNYVAAFRWADAVCERREKPPQGRLLIQVNVRRPTHADRPREKPATCAGV